jgi:hypothetical protein
LAGSSAAIRACTAPRRGLPGEAFAPEPDAVAHRLAAFAHQIEEVIVGIDDDRARAFARGIGDELAIVDRIDTLDRDRRKRELFFRHRAVHGEIRADRRADAGAAIERRAVDGSGLSVERRRRRTCGAAGERQQRRGAAAEKGASPDDRRSSCRCTDFVFVLHHVSRC